VVTFQQSCDGSLAARQWFAWLISAVLDLFKLGLPWSALRCSLDMFPVRLQFCAVWAGVPRVHDCCVSRRPNHHMSLGITFFRIHIFLYMGIHELWEFVNYICRSTKRTFLGVTIWASWTIENILAYNIYR
jgi:hypothetical protein